MSTLTEDLLKVAHHHDKKAQFHEEAIATWGYGSQKKVAKHQEKAAIARRAIKTLQDLPHAERCATEGPSKGPCDCWKKDV